MRIYFDHQVFSLQTYGGISKLFSYLSGGLASTGVADVDVMLGYTDSEARFDRSEGNHLHVYRLGKALVPSRPVNYLINEVIAGALSRVMPKYDIYQSTYNRYNPLIRSRYKVSWHHDCAPEVYPELFDDSARTIRLRRRLYTESDRILCISESSRKDLMRFYEVPREKTGVVHGIITQMEQSPEGDRELATTIDGEFLLHVGPRYLYKNFSAFLRAFAASGLSRDFSILALGGGPLSQEHVALAEECGIRDRVKNVPFASQALLSSAYARAAVLVYPSLYEGFGFPPLEAALMGTVSVVADQPAGLETCGDGAFFFDRASIASFAETLARSVHDQSARELLLARAQLRARSYNLESCVQQTLAEYRHLVG